MLPGREDPHKLRGSMITCVGTFSRRPAGFFLAAGLQASFANVYVQSNKHKLILFK